MTRESLLNPKVTAADVAATYVTGVHAGLRERLRPNPTYLDAAKNEVMASIPTIAENAAPTITAQIIDAKTDARIRSLCGTMILSSDTNWLIARGPRKTDGTFDAGTPDYWSSIEFMADCTAVEFRILGFAQKYVLVVDGKRHTATNGQLANTGASRYLNFNFGARKADGTPRRIQLCVDQGYFREVRLAAIDTMFGVATKPAPKLAILGDSYGTGYATRAMVSTYDAYPQQLARLLGMQAITQNCASNTGYVHTNGATASTFSTRVADIIAAAPDLVIVQGSINDYADTPSAVGAAAAVVFAALKAGLPGALIIATGILDARNTSAQSTDAAQNTVIQNAATAAGVYYLDTASWVAGTGEAGATTGDGNCDVFTYSDATHPTTAGGLYFASRMYFGIKQIIDSLIT